MKDMKLYDTLISYLSKEWRDSIFIFRGVLTIIEKIIVAI